METTRVLWIGTGGLCPQGASLLHAAGFRVETGLHAQGVIDVVVVAADPVPTGLLSTLPEGARGIAICRDSAGVAAALAAGASDALLAAEAPKQLPARVGTWGRVALAERAAARRVRELEKEVADGERRMLELEALAHEDELTQLGNRRSLKAALDYALEYGARYGGPLAVVMADLDGMKALNDRFGHPAGDAALKQVGEVIRSSLRLTDHAARLGGDEFGIVMPQTRAEAAARVADRIRDRIHSMLLPGAARLSASFGVTSVTHASEATAAMLIDRADRALYRSKAQGKNRVTTDEAQAA
jgi:diguanylate cyclase (GGDEF)-like protein